MRDALERTDEPARHPVPASPLPIPLSVLIGQRLIRLVQWLATSLLGPLVVTGVLLALGYARYAPGTAYDQSADAYRDWAFPAFKYSDIIWLYLRDNLSAHPIPYVDYKLEYPPLTGLLSYALSFLPGLSGYFTLAYLILASSVIGTVVLLHRSGHANTWYYAAAPAVMFYPGSQWDPVAIFVTMVAVLRFQRGRDRWGAVAITAAVWLKFFPLVFLAAALVERVRERRYRAAAEIAGIFTAGSILINLPIALVGWNGWSYFFAWNGERIADGGFWVLFRQLSTAEATQLSFALVALGGLVLAAVGFRARTPILIPLGATLLLWWLFANKMFTAHLMLWVYLAVAMLRPPWWVWVGLVGVDIFHFQVGSYVNLSTLDVYQYRPLISEAWQHLIDPSHLLRSVLLLISVGWGVLALIHSPHASLADGRLTPMPPATNFRLLASDLRQASAIAWTSITVAAPTWGGIAGEAARVRLASWRWSAGVTVVLVVATAVMTWPFATHLKDSTVVSVDPLLQIWLARWIQHGLVTNPLGLFDANIFYPFQQTLAFTDANLPGALLAAPLFLLTGDAILTNNLLLLGSFVLAAAGMYALVARVSGNRAAGLLAGLAYSFLSFRFIHLWHLNWLFHAWMPLVLLALLLLIERPTRWRAVSLGVLVAVQSLTSFYFVVQLGILLGATLVVAWLVDGRARTPRFLVHLTVAAGIAAVLAVPFYVPYLNVRDAQGFERTIDEAEYWKATPRSYITVEPWQGSFWASIGLPHGENRARGLARHPDGHVHQDFIVEDALFPGGLALVGAVAGVIGWRRRRAFTAAMLLAGGSAFILSLGPALGRLGDGSMPLPYRFLYEHVPIFAAMRVPARLGGLVDFTVVVLAGLGAAWIWDQVQVSRITRRTLLQNHHRTIGAFLTALVAVLLLTELYPGEIPLEKIDRGEAASAPYEWLANQPGDGALMEFPAEDQIEGRYVSSARRHTGLAMYWSTVHWKPLVNGNSGFIPRTHLDLLDAFISDLRRSDGSVARNISHVTAKNIGLLQQIGVKYLLFHRSQYATMDWRAVQDKLDRLGDDVEKAGDFGDATIYLVKPPESPIQTPSLTVSGPTMTTAGSFWEPTLSVTNANKQLALLGLTQPLTLSTTWFDTAGREIQADERWLDIPAVIEPGRLDCSLQVCEPVDDPADLPTRPVQDVDDDELEEEDIGRTVEIKPWTAPVSPGQYTVHLELSGEVSLSCDMEIEIAPEIQREEAGAWWTCDPGAANEDGTIEPELREPPRATTPGVLYVNGDLTIATTLTTPNDGEIQAWFFLSRPGQEEPWRRFVYRSPTMQKLVSGGEGVDFGWIEPIVVPDGVYQLSVWFQRRTDGIWKHEVGGSLGLGPILISRDRPTAGPFQIVPWEAPPPAAAGRHASVRLAVKGSSSTASCRVLWTLRQPVGSDAPGAALAWGQTWDCGLVRPAIPPNLPPGHYDLELTALATTDDETIRSDRIMVDIVVADLPGW